MTEQSRNKNQNRNKTGGGVDVAEGAAWTGGMAAGAALGSALGPLGTAAGAVAGGALADEGVENVQATGSVTGGGKNKKDS